MNNDKKYIEAYDKNHTSREAFRNWGRLLWENRSVAIVNCTHQCAVGYYLLDPMFRQLLSRDFYIDVLSMTDNNDKRAFSHDVLIFKNYPPKKPMPDNTRKAWHQNDFIIDPRAKIYCPAHEYAEHWNEKMRKWDSRNLS
ncbi:hypothetical protein [Acerihabitans arboris]|uniref:Uncharacterized protein n=1 Tax=Acerihabitans arboris TaxID=2691583 RepID=A0A845SG62_9GAMM|nr:hypothetical protein [Acerihabitans arboris]NDL62859.1 hypothetical protein [Acerihabitans arboris]